MRLIDADALEKTGLMLVKLSDKPDKLLTKFEWKDVPTAYDVEAKVAELEKLSAEADIKFGMAYDSIYLGKQMGFDRAIEIVRGKE